MKKTKVIILRVTPAEKLKMQLLAKVNKLSLSKYLIQKSI